MTKSRFSWEPIGFYLDFRLFMVELSLLREKITVFGCTLAGSVCNVLATVDSTSLSVFLEQMLELRVYSILKLTFSESRLVAPLCGITLPHHSILSPMLLNKYNNPLRLGHLGIWKVLSPICRYCIALISLTSLMFSWCWAWIVFENQFRFNPDYLESLYWLTLTSEQMVCMGV